MDKITSPIYLLKSHTSCWKCGKEQTVVGLMAQYHEWVEEGDADGRYESDMARLSYIEFMPEEILLTLREHQPSYEFHYSYTADGGYYANTCECGAFFGDFFLYSEPDGAFFPINDKEATEIAYLQLPFEGELDIDCSSSIGLAELILHHGKKLVV